MRFLLVWRDEYTLGFNRYQALRAESGALWVCRVNGSRFEVVGLDLCRVL
jgi:hypothetical protein